MCFGVRLILTSVGKMGLLDELKKEAEAKQNLDEAEQKRRAAMEARSRESVLPKMAQIYGFLSDLLKQLEIIQPDTRVAYPMVGYGSVENLHQKDYKLKVDSRENMTHVSLVFNCVGKDKIHFDVAEKLHVERQKDYLNEHHLSFYSRDYRDERHTVTHSSFTVESKIPVLFDFRLAEDLSTIELTIRNFEGLGKHRYTLDPQMIDGDYLDELGKYLLRMNNDFLKLDLPDDFRDSIRQRLDSDSKQAKKTKPASKPRASNVTYIDEKRKKVVAEKAKKIEPESVKAQQEEPLPEQEEAPITRIKAANEAKHEPGENERYTKFANLPTPINELSRQELDKKVYAERLQQLRNFPDKLFQNAAQSLSSLNRAIIKPAKRQELLNAIIGQVYPVIASTFQKYQKQQHSLPENHTRREVLLACASLVEQISITYKHLFKYYVDENSGKNDEEILSNGFRILEMLRLEQHLRALRYQKMPASAWRDCNAVFFYLYQHADIDKQQMMIGTAGMWAQQRELKGREGPVCTVKMMYLSIQLFGMLDVTSWPLWLLHVPDTYLAWLDDALKIMPDKGQQLVPGFMISAVNHDGPASFERQEKMQQPSILIDYAVLFNFLVKEHEELSKMRMSDCVDEDKLSKPLRDIHDHDRIPVLEMILLSLHNRQRIQQRHTAIGNEDLRVYFGFEDSYRLLSHLAATDKSELKEMRDFVDALAGKSSLLLDENQKASPAWEMLNFSTGGLLLGTEETDFLSPIEVGHIVAFQPANNSQAPVMGYVSRAQRTSYHNVEIAITRISNHAEAALAVKSDARKKIGVPVILLQDLDGQWRVLVQNQHGFSKGSPLQIIRSDGKKIPARLGGIWLVKSRFTVYELSSPKLN